MELSAAIVILAVGLAGLLLELLAMSQQTAELEARASVEVRAASLMERIVGTDPSTVPATFDGTTHEVSGVQGSYPNGHALRADISEPQTGLLEVVITGSWTVAARSHDLTLRTEIHSP